MNPDVYSLATRCSQLVADLGYATIGDFLSVCPPPKSAYIRFQYDRDVDAVFRLFFGRPIFRVLHDVFFIRESNLLFIESLRPQTFKEQCMDALLRIFCLPACTRLQKHSNYVKFREFFVAKYCIDNSTYFNEQKSAERSNLFEALCSILNVDDFQLISTLMRKKREIQQLFLYEPHEVQCPRSRSAGLNTNELTGSVEEYECEKERKISLSAVQDDEKYIYKLVCGSALYSYERAVAVLRRCDFCTGQPAVGGEPAGGSRLSVIQELCTNRRLRSTQQLADFLLQKRLELGLSRSQSLASAAPLSRCRESPLLSEQNYQVLEQCRSGSLGRSNSARRASSTCVARRVTHVQSYQHTMAPSDEIDFARRLANARLQFPHLDARGVANTRQLELAICQLFGCCNLAPECVNAVLTAYGVGYEFSSLYELAGREPTPLETRFGDITLCDLLETAACVQERQYCTKCTGAEEFCLSAERIMGCKLCPSPLLRLVKMQRKLGLVCGDILETLHQQLLEQELNDYGENYRRILALFLEVRFKQKNATDIEMGLSLMLRRLISQARANATRFSASQSDSRGSGSAQKKSSSHTDELQCTDHEASSVVNAESVIRSTCSCSKLRISYAGSGIIENDEQIDSTRGYLEENEKSLHLIFGGQPEELQDSTLKLINKMNECTDVELFEIRLFCLELLDDPKNHALYQKCFAITREAGKSCIRELFQ